VNAFQVLTGLAGDAFPSQTRALSGSAYPAFSLQGLDSLSPVRVARGMYRRSESSTPIQVEDGRAVHRLAACGQAGGPAEAAPRAKDATKRRGTRLD
jgi:hypothetical protein